MKTVEVLLDVEVQMLQIIKTFFMSILKFVGKCIAALFLTAVYYCAIPVLVLALVIGACYALAGAARVGTHGVNELHKATNAALDEE